MNMKTIPLWLALAGAALAPAARACEMCSVYTATEAKESRPGFYVTYFEQETDFGTLQVDGEKIDNEAGESLRSSMHHLIVGYQIDRRLGVQVNVPYLDRRFDRAAAGGLESGSESGLGDVALVAHWRVVERLNGDTTWSWGLLGGVELPTGDSDLLALELAEDHGEEGGEPGVHEEESGIHPHDLVQGSGSTDYLLGTNFHFGKSRFFADASLQYAVRTKGDFDYRFANETNVELGVGGFAWLSQGRALALELTLSSERKGKDELAGQAVDDTARRTVYLGPSLSYSHHERFLGELFVDFPVDQDNSALQIVPDRRLRIALTGRF